MIIFDEDIFKRSVFGYPINLYIKSVDKIFSKILGVDTFLFSNKTTKKEIITTTEDIDQSIKGFFKYELPYARWEKPLEEMLKYPSCYEKKLFKEAFKRIEKLELKLSV